MPFDEILLQQVALVQGYWGAAFTRWRDAANAARSNNFTIAQFFEVCRTQFVANWDTWNQVMALPIQHRLPTITVTGKYDQFSVVQPSGTVVVTERLDAAATFNQVDLQRTRGGNVIAAADYSITVGGDFNGSVTVTMLNDIAAAQAPAAGVDDVYVGPLLVKPTAADPHFRPLAWIVVVAEP